MGRHNGWRLAVFRTPRSAFRPDLRVFLGLAQTGDAVALLPLAAFLEQFNPLKALKHVSLAADGGRRAQTPML